MRLNMRMQMCVCVCKEESDYLPRQNKQQGSTFRTTRNARTIINEAFNYYYRIIWEIPLCDCSTREREFMHALLSSLSSSFHPANPPRSL